MKRYIDHLRAERERAKNESKEAIRAAERKRLRDSRIQCDIPLTNQIEALMRSLPPAQRNRPWAMDELVARLHGRYNARPCAGSIGLALRRLGWTRSRDWSQDGGGRRVWRTTV
ncbi:MULTISPECIES: hypothetical protein [unclassified Roseobacter]|uniref:hypothetical protein n=1 Tax=unclassified Roseobacter TaxID=196798 RepID=UPI001D3E55F8|nr:hypothetical protein [Rhodobacterales bacterium FZCC0069]MBF9024067.1 hypothetical protein [Rhodobacterales bacterium HKCCD6035]